MAYVFIPDDTLEQFKINKEHTLSPEELVNAILHKKLIKKLLMQKCFSIQVEIGTGKYRGSEEVYHTVIEKIKEVCEFIDLFETKYEEYKQTVNK